MDTQQFANESANAQLDQQTLLSYIPKPSALKGQSILITGAGSGIGRALAIACAYYGAEVVLLGHQVSQLEAVYDEIMLLKQLEPSIYPLDMRGANQQDYRDMADTIVEQLGGIDAVVLNAGWLPAYIPFASYELETWMQTFNVHVHGNFLLLQACIPALLNSPAPSIVYSSHEASKAYAGAFGAARAAQDSMMKIVAEEHASERKFIQVNGIDSGPINTAMRRLNHPGDAPSELADASALVGAYLYFLCADSTKNTGHLLRFERLPADQHAPAFSPIKSLLNSNPLH